MNKRNLFFLLLFAPLCLFAQKNAFLPATLTLKDGETLNGLIKETGKTERSRFIIYKSMSDNSITKYYADQVKSYRIEGLGSYISFKVGFAGMEPPQTVFLQALVESELSLYRLDYETENTPPPFLSYDNTFFLLKDKNSTGMLLLQKEQFKEQAFVFGEGCEAKKLNYAYNQMRLVEMIVAINECNGQVVNSLEEERKDKEKVQIYVGLSLGVHGSDMQVDLNVLNDLQSGVGVEVGFFMDISIYKQLSIKQGLFFIAKNSSYKVDHIVAAPYENEGEVIKISQELKYKHLAIPVVIKQRFLSKTSRFQPYAFVGGQFGVAVGNKAEYTEAVIELERGLPTGQEVARTREVFNYKFSTYDLGYRLGAGLEVLLPSEQKIFAEFVLSRTQNSNSGSGFISTMTYGGTVGLMF